MNIQRTNDSSNILKILNPRGGGGRGRRRNHHHNNIRILRDLQAQRRCENEERRLLMEEKRRDGDFKMRKFKGVESKVKEDLRNREASFQRRKRQHMREREEEEEQEDGRTGPTPYSFKRGGGAGSAPRGKGKGNVPRLALRGGGGGEGGEERRSTRRRNSKPAVPRASDCIFTPKRHEARNYVMSNAMDATKHTHGRLQKERGGGGRRNVEKTNKHLNGEVPQYLLERKDELREEERRRQERREQEHIPSGMTLMAEEERVRTISVLEENKRVIEEKINRFPLVVDTIGKRRRKKDLEEKLMEIDEALKVFAKKQVFISQ